VNIIFDAMRIIECEDGCLSPPATGTFISGDTVFSWYPNEVKRTLRDGPAGEGKIEALGVKWPAGRKFSG
jgi:hypothetical protein